MPTKTQRVRLAAVEAKRKPPPRVFVVIGADEPRRPGDVYIGGVPTDERPGPDDVVVRVMYEQSPVTNPAPGAASAPPVPPPPVQSADVPPVPTIEPDSRIGRAYGAGWRNQQP